jgi:hypothetical protein
MVASRAKLIAGMRRFPKSVAGHTPICIPPSRPYVVGIPGPRRFEYVGQFHYDKAGGWVDVAFGETLADATRAAAVAYAEPEARPIGVRVIRRGLTSSKRPAERTTG